MQKPYSKITTSFYARMKLTCEALQQVLGCRSDTVCEKFIYSQNIGASTHIDFLFHIALRKKKGDNKGPKKKSDL